MTRFSVFKIWIIPAIIFAILVVAGAFAHPLWSDEAETPLFAGSILRYGFPYGWDGVNLLSYGITLNRDLINFNQPWLQYYLAAISLLLLPVSSFTVRLPFILLSICIIPILYFTTMRITKDKTVAFITILLTSLSVPFILFSYQARYYPLTIFFGLCFLYSSLNLTKNRINKLLFFISGVLYIFSHYLSFLFFFVSAFFALCIYYKLTKQYAILKKTITSYLALGGIIFAFFLPWLLYFRPFAGRGKIIFTSFINIFAQMPNLFWESLEYFNDQNAFPVLIIPILALTVILKRKEKATLAVFTFLIAIPFFYLLLVAAFSGIFFSDTPFTTVRHNMVLFPVFTVILGIIVSSLWRIHKILGLLLLFLLLFTNVLTLKPMRSFLFDYFGKLIHPYKTPDVLVADYLQEYAKDGDTAFISQERNHEPLLFHLGNKIRFVNRIGRFNFIVYPDNRMRLPEYVYNFKGAPDWIILYGKHRVDLSLYSSFETFDFRDYKTILGLSDFSDYEEIVLPVYFADHSRPEIEIHAFREIKPGYNEQVFIYRKKIKI